MCCPASLKIQKTGSCPIDIEKHQHCGAMCTHDLECPSVQKCCNTEQCGQSCVHPKNVTGKLIVKDDSDICYFIKVIVQTTSYYNIVMRSKKGLNEVCFVSQAKWCVIYLEKLRLGAAYIVKT